jgi:uncharacterized protein YqgC (DUF456 family)
MAFVLCYFDMGIGELFYLLISVLFAVWGYKAGAKRRVGAILGLLLGFFFSLVGIIIIYLVGKK